MVIKKVFVRPSIDSLNLFKESDNRSEEKTWMNENRFELKLISNSPGPATQEFFWIRRWPSWKTFHLTQVSFYKQNTSAKGRKRIQSSIIFHFKRFSVTSIPFRMRTFVCKSRKSARNAAGLFRIVPNGLPNDQQTLICAQSFVERSQTASKVDSPRRQ